MSAPLGLDVDLAPVLHRSLEQIQRGKVAPAAAALLEAVERHPMARGAADALYHLGVVAMELGRLHEQEVYCLLTHRVRATAIAEEIPFNNLVNLSRACLSLKSFREAWNYGCLAERLRDDDADLLANLLAIGALLGEPDRDRRLDRLRAIDLSKVAVLTETLAGRTSFQPTRDLDGRDLAREFDRLAKSSIDTYLSLLAELERRPDCRGADRCWRKLTQAYVEGLAEDPGQGMKFLFNCAGAAAAAGKAINASADDASGDAELWGWYGATLAQLCLYEAAVPALERALAIGASPRTAQNLEETRRLASLPEDSIERMDSPAHLAHLRARAGVAPPAPARDETRLAALCAEVAALREVGLAQRRSAVENLRRRAAEAHAPRETSELELALAIVLGLAAFATVDEGRDPGDDRAGREMAREALNLYERLARRLGSDEADRLAQAFGGESLADYQAHALSELALLERKGGDLPAAQQTLQVAVDASPASPKLRCNLAGLLLEQEAAGRSRDPDRCLAILDHLEEAQRNGPYASIGRILGPFLALEGLELGLAGRGAALRLAVEMGTAPRAPEPPATAAQTLAMPFKAPAAALSECDHNEVQRMTRASSITLGIILLAAAAGLAYWKQILLILSVPLAAAGLRLLALATRRDVRVCRACGRLLPP